MEESNNNSSASRRGLRLRLHRAWEPFSKAPLLGWLFGFFIATALEQLVGTPLSHLLGLPKIPVLFGFVIILKQPALLPSTILYVLLIYLIPTGLIAWLSTPLANKIAEKLLKYPLIVSLLVHVGLLYASLYFWAEINDYRDLILRLMLISIIITLSLNVVNGYMGEFSCSHPGFIALGAYGASVFSVLMFVNDDIFGAPLLPPALGPFMFPISLIAGGFVAAIASLLVAIPSFRTRGDYLAIISLAFMFIIKSLVENLEIVGGPRGFMNQPDWANLPTVFIWTMLSIWIINNFVRSTYGKALNAVRDEEIAANSMTVNTKRTKTISFMFAAFWAGVAGGLFAHVMRYVNPGTFGIQKLAEVLAMVYFGGLNSVVGSVVGAVGFNILSEALRPLEMFKWIIIPVLLILVMIYRPSGLIAFREFDIAKIVQPKRKPEEEVENAITSD
ncbi:MAG: branched-chain amino acid ABC transporter permease [Anaerolineales bacterium]|nr:branched-chain amino acid ABC transporter permease [Anaerolineales bacterium]